MMTMTIHPDPKPMTDEQTKAGAALPEGRRLAIARDEFFASLSGATLEGAPSGRYLRNRLELAFIAGWDARSKEATPQPPPEAGSVGVPEGWALVPKEPTQAMLDAGREAFRSYAFRWMEGHPAVYEAMLSAAPAPKEIKP